MNIIKFELQTLGGVNLIRVKVSQLRGVRSVFAAPEMRSGEDCTAKIDVFAFALILFKIVVGLPALGRTGGSKGLRKLPVNACECIDISGFVKTAFCIFPFSMN
jgi:hypothetical protein